MRALLGLVFIVFSVGAGAQADSYLCIADQATGFKFNKTTKTWAPATFNVTDDKFVISRSKTEKHVWKMTIVGEKQPYTCRDQTPEYEDNLFCDVAFTKFQFSLESLRYMSVHPFGYVDPFTELFKEGGQTPYMQIGKCSPL